MITYLRYTAGTNKGGVDAGDLFNGVYKIGPMDENRETYTSDRVVETVAVSTDTITLAWAPIAEIANVIATKADESMGGVTVNEAASDFANGTVKFAAGSDFEDKGNFVGDGATTDFTVAGTATSVTAVTVNGVAQTVTTDYTVSGSVVSFTTAPADGAVIVITYQRQSAIPTEVKVAYVYDNVVIPQQKGTNAPLPTLKAEMAAIDLHAHARRIAVYYSQIAAFQAKTDYGYDLADQLSAQAQGELAYEIDSEGVFMLANGAESDAALAFDSYERHQAIASVPTYISRSQYYEGFGEIIARAKKVIYNRTQKFAPNYMVCGSNILTIMPYLKGWTAAPASSVNGPYFAGTIDSLKVFVSPALDENTYFFGVNGSDLQTAAAVYAPYMAIVPTQLLGFADGGMSQGFSTMYDMKLLSTYNRVDGAIVDAIGGQYSHLLVKGALNVALS